MRPVFGSMVTDRLKPDIAALATLPLKTGEG